MPPEFLAGSAAVRVPATSANLGPGFDALGLALELADEMSARVTSRGVTGTVTGEGADLTVDEAHLVVRAMRAAFVRLGGQPAGLELACTNLIPHSRGLGSSAAAIVGGILLARALVDRGPELMPDAEVLALASEVEGHPDNVAACLFGGLTIAWTEVGEGRSRTARAVRLDCDPRIVPVAFVPPFTASTAEARGLLPATLAHGDAAFAAGRAALLVAALTGAVDALLPATEDRLHQTYRAPAMPESAALVARLRDDGVPAVISGAGPTVLALTRDPDETAAARDAAPPGWRAEVLAVAAAGASVVTSFAGPT